MNSRDACKVQKRFNSLHPQKKKKVYTIWAGFLFVLKLSWIPLKSKRKVYDKTNTRILASLRLEMSVAFIFKYFDRVLIFDCRLELLFPPNRAWQTVPLLVISRLFAFWHSLEEIFLLSVFETHVSYVCDSFSLVDPLIVENDLSTLSFSHLSRSPVSIFSCVHWSSTYSQKWMRNYHYMARWTSLSEGKYIHNLWLTGISYNLPSSFIINSIFNVQ